MPVKSPTKTPTISPTPDPEPSRRYNPKPGHCPGQWKRTVRRVREV